MTYYYYYTTTYYYYQAILPTHYLLTYGTKITELVDGAKSTSETSKMRGENRQPTTERALPSLSPDPYG